MGDSMGKYVIPGLMTAAGAASEVVAPGNPIGLGVMGSGVGQLAGGAAGGSRGQALGGGLGGLAGLGGGLVGGGGLTGGGGLSGMMSNLNPANAGFGTGGALASNPATAGITPDMVMPGGSSMPGSGMSQLEGPLMNFLGRQLQPQQPSQAPPPMQPPMGIRPPQTGGSPQPPQVTPPMAAPQMPQGAMTPPQIGQGLPPQVLALLRQLTGGGPMMG
jgi:hypothetical protein